MTSSHAHHWKQSKETSAEIFDWVYTKYKTFHFYWFSFFFIKETNSSKCICIDPELSSYTDDYTKLNVQTTSVIYNV